MLTDAKELTHSLPRDEDFTIINEEHFFKISVFLKRMFSRYYMYSMYSICDHTIVCYRRINPLKTWVLLTNSIQSVARDPHITNSDGGTFLEDDLVILKRMLDNLQEMFTPCIVILYVQYMLL